MEEIEIRKIVYELITEVTDKIFEETADKVLVDSPIAQESVDEAQIDIPSSAFVVYQPSSRPKGTSVDLMYILSKTVSVHFSPSVPSAFHPFKQLTWENPIFLPRVQSGVIEVSQESCSSAEVIQSVVEETEEYAKSNDEIRQEKKDLSPIYLSPSKKDQVLPRSQLDDILTAIFTLQGSVAQLQSDQYIINDTVSSIKSSLEDNLKRVSSNISDLISDLDKKFSKSSINLAKSQDIIAQRIDLLQSRFDSIESKLDDILEKVSSIKPSDVVIAKKGESSSQPKERSVDSSRKRVDPSFHQTDKGPDPKRSKF